MVRLLAKNQRPERKPLYSVNAMHGVLTKGLILDNEVFQKLKFQILGLFDKLSRKITSFDSPSRNSIT